MGVNRLGGASGDWLTALPRRIPLTLALMILITAIALGTGALTTGASAATVARWGSSLDNLRRGRLLTVFTADCMVYGKRHFLSTLFMIAAVVAPVEWIAGSRFTAAVYWPGSISGTVITSLITALLESITTWSPIPDMISTADIGASVATWSAAGALTVLLDRIDPRLVWPVRLSVAAFLLARLILFRQSSDLAHPIGFCIGMGIATMLERSRRRLQVLPGEPA